MHDYSSKTQAELAYIAKDASEACLAARSNGDKVAEAKYQDQVNEAVSEAARRVPAGTREVTISPCGAFVNVRGTVRLPNGDGTFRHRTIRITIDTVELWNDMAPTAAKAKTGRCVLGGGSIKAVRQGSR